MDDLLHQLSARKRGLFAVACCRRVWSLLMDERSRRTLETLERFIDGNAVDDELQAVAIEAAAAAADAEDAAFFTTRALAAVARAAEAVRVAATLQNVPQVAQLAAAAVGHANSGSACDDKTLVTFQAWIAAKGTSNEKPAMHAWFKENDRAQAIEQSSIKAETELQAHVLRDLVGTTSDLSAWRSPAVAALAAEIYERNAFDLMPTLGAALSDAGCRNTILLEHCSVPLHVKGCFLLDALLGKGSAPRSG